MRNERLDGVGRDCGRMDWDVVVATAQEKWRNTDPAEGKTFWDRTVKNREFWVSTGVDFAVSVAVGAAAAAVVAGGIALASVLLPVSAVAIVAAPAVAVGVTALVGMGIGWGVDAIGFPNWAKSRLNGLFSGK